MDRIIVTSNNVSTRLKLQFFPFHLSGPNKPNNLFRSIVTRSTWDLKKLSKPIWT